MSSLFYRRPRLLLLALALIFVSGFSALEVLPRAEDPELTSRNARVVTFYPGADAERVESEVTEKIEEELEEVDEIQLLESVSSAGLSVVAVELLDAVTETDAIWSRVRDRLDDAAVELPPGATSPEFEEIPISAWSMHIALADVDAERAGTPAGLALLAREAEDLEDVLRGVRGTAETEVYGDIEEEIVVSLDPVEAATLGLAPERIAAEIAAADSKVPSGQLDASRRDVLVEVAGELDGVARVAEVPLLVREDGSVLRVGDVASVRRTVEEPAAELALVDGRPGVFVAARIRTGERVDRWATRARAAIAEFEGGLAQGLELEITFDQSEYTADRLDELFANLALGAALVVGILLLTMGWRSAVVVGLALPLSALMTLAGMSALGIPMHQMSVTGLIIALGLLIDNAIVIVDEVGHRLESEDSVARAVGAAVRALAVPLAASTTTTVLAFLPLVLAAGPVGEFVGAMSVSVILAVVSSFALSLTVIPAIAGRLRAPVGRGARSLWSHGIRTRVGERLYARALGFLFRYPMLAVALAVALPAVGIWKAGELQEQFFPPSGRDQAALELRLAETASIGRTREVVERAQELLREHPDVATVHWVIGRSAPKFYYNQLELEESTPSFAGGIVELVGDEDSPRVLGELQRLLDTELVDAQVLVKQMEQGPPFDAPVELILQGDDLAVLRERGEALRALLSRVPDVTHTRSGVGVGRAKLVLEPSDEELERTGLDRVALAKRLQASLRGAVGGSVFAGDEELSVRVRFDAEHRAEESDLGSLALATGAGAGDWFPLDGVATASLRPEPSRILHRSGRRTNEVQAFLVPGTLPQDALDRAVGLLEGFELPPGYTLELGGESAERDDAVGSLAATVGILAVLMAATLVVSFQSFRVTGIVAGVAMLSVGLSLGALWVFGYPFGFMAIVGTMGLIGIAINDSIVVLAALRADPLAREGDREAAVAVVVRASRHVFSTTLTTVAGFLPLLLQAQGLWPPLATSVAGGVVGATLLALTFAPGCYLLFACRRAAAPAPQLAPA